MLQTMFAGGIWNSGLLVCLCPIHSFKQANRWCCGYLDLYKVRRMIFIRDSVMPSHLDLKVLCWKWNSWRVDLPALLCVSVFSWPPALFAVQWWKCPQTSLCQKNRRGYTSEMSSWASSTVSVLHRTYTPQLETHVCFYFQNNMF